jgi:hypothetical protein
MMDSAKNLCGSKTGAVGCIIREVVQENSVLSMTFHCITHNFYYQLHTKAWFDSLPVQTLFRGN